MIFLLCESWIEIGLKLSAILFITHVFVERFIVVTGSILIRAGKLLSLVDFSS